MKKLSVLCVIIVLAVSTNAQTQNDGEIRGAVTDSTGRGLLGAHIDLLYRSGATSRFGTVTDVDGRYAITTLRPGYYSVQYTYKSYGTIIVSHVIVNSDNTTALEVMLHPADGKEIEVVEYVKPLLNFQGVKIK